MRLGDLILVLLAAVLPLCAQAPTREQRLREDLNFISTELPRRHPNFFFQVSREDFDLAVRELERQIPSLTDTALYVHLAAIVALAGDSHTSLSLNGTAAASFGFREFPLLFRWLDDGVFVTDAAGEYSRALGAQLIRVGDFPIEEVVRRLDSVISNENSQWLYYLVQPYLRGQQILQGLGLLPDTPASRLTFRNRAGEEFALEIRPLVAPLLPAPAPGVGPLPEYLQRGSENYWFTYSGSRRLLYFRYNRCSETPGRPFAAFAFELLRAIDANPVDTLTLDLRGNTGGNSALIDPFFQGVADRLPVLLANSRFRIYGVIDKGTFSSGLLNAMDFKTPLPPQFAALFPGLDASRLVRIIGEPTGGKPDAYGEVLPFTLPDSRLVGQHSTRLFTRPDYIPDGPWFAPDIPVEIRSSDFFARHDPVLAAILARSEGPPNPPAGEVIAVNAATFRVAHGFAPGSLASAFGRFPENVDEALVNGQPGRILSVSALQINFVVPASARPGRATVTIRARGVEVASGEVSITPAGPGIFVLQPADPAQPGAVLNQDLSINGPASPAAKGSIVAIFATGYGPLDPSGTAAAQVFVAGEPAQILFSGPTPQFPGLWQINAQLPESASGQAPLFVIAESLASNGVTIRVE